MTFGMGLGAGLKALNAARLGVETAGHNISNANTTGYTRQRVMLAASLPFSLGRGLQIGSGVDVNAIARLADEGLETRMRFQIGVSGGAEVDQSRWKEIEGLFDEPNGGLSTALAGIFNNVQKLQTDPKDRALRGGVIQSGKTVAENFNLLATRFADLGNGTFAEVQ